MSRLLTTFFAIIPLLSISAQKLKVSDNNRYLVTEEGTPFFYMADTAWELFHRCDRQEADFYLKKRASQGFNVVQAVALAELDGLNTPNAYGHTPLLNNDPKTPNNAYFEHVDHIIKKADSLNLYIALLPTWGDKVFKNNWGKGPEIFTPENARVFGNWIGKRYADYDNIIWIIGGDRNPREGSSDVEIWNQLAEGIAGSAGGYDNTLMSFHPQPNAPGGSSTWFHYQPWLDFNMHQTGHCPDQATYRHINHDYLLAPTKPTVDGEPLYEDHPNCFNAKELGHSLPEAIRRIMYSNVFAGAMGQTYGCHDVWQMYKTDKEAINQPLRPWPIALDLPMANQMRHLKNLMLSRPYLGRIPDQSVIVSAQPGKYEDVIATRDEAGSYAMVYFPIGQPIELDITALKGDKFTTWWYDPRTGSAFKNPVSIDSKKVAITPPSSGKGHDWILVIDEGGQNYSPPGSSD